VNLQEVIERTEFEPTLHDESKDCWVAFLDRDLKIVSTNGKCRELFGWAPDDIRNKRLGDVVNLAPLTSLIVLGFCFRKEPKHIKGRKMLCSYVPILEDQSALGGFLSLGEADGEAQPSLPEDTCNVARSMGPLIDIVQDGLVVVDREGIIRMVNQHFADAVGSRAQDMIGKQITEAYSNSKTSRLPVVMETGQAEVGWPHLINGKEVVACRYPLIREGRCVGALGRIMFSDVREVTLLANQIHNLMNRQKIPPAIVSKNCDFKYDINSIIGHSKVISQLKSTLLRVAKRGSNILLVGESGTGKELCAHSVHAASKRRYGPFIKMNCAAIPEHLLESELFGYAEGAFTGARKGGMVGKFEQAHGGTLFLDEISDMSLSMQAKLLRVLQEKEVTPLGSDTTRPVDVRVVAATNVNLVNLVKEEKFRKDLYFRLNIVALSIPPLRERVEDIFFITKHFIDSFNTEFGLKVEGLEPEAWDLLKAYDFPGNIRELRNVIENGFNVVRGSHIRASDLPDYIRQSSALMPLESEGCLNGDYSALIGKKPLGQILEEVERNIIKEAIVRAGGNKLQVASLLKISRPGLYKKLQKYELS